METRRASRSLARIPHAEDEFRQPGVVRRSDDAPGTRSRGHLLPQYPVPRAPREVHDGLLRIRFVLGTRRNETRRDLKELGETISISQEPRFDLPHCDAEAHLASWVRQPIAASCRGTRVAPVQIDENHPRLELGGSVEAWKLPQEVALPFAPIRGAGGGAKLGHDSTQNDFVECALDRT